MHFNTLSLSLCRKSMATKEYFSDEIVKESGNENVVVYRLDLSSFTSIREFAAKLNAKEERLDVLCHNAGYANYFSRAVSCDGIEMTMATNHYGPFLLTHLLIDLMKKTATVSPCRIVVVASKTHTLSFMNPLNEYHLNPVGFLLPTFLYGNSKFANFLFTFECARRLKNLNITVNCLHPGELKKHAQNKRSDLLHSDFTHSGVIDSGIWRNLPFPLNLLFSISKVFIKNLEEGTQTTLYAMMSDDLKGVTGKYFRDCQIGRPRVDVHNVPWQEAMWEASKKLCKLTEQDPKI
jgi:NAD(P)-dependent dehydrogenase (short-subunit alcohol dehydrogenase family)